VVTDSGGGSYPWYHDVWALSWETDFSNATMEDFSCAPNRGRPGNTLFILNRFLTSPVAYRDLAVQANASPSFLDFAEQCWAEGGQIPNFVTVDFVDEGALFAVVDALNDLFASGVVTVFGDVLALLGIITAMLWMNWRLALVAFVVAKRFGDKSANQFEHLALIVLSSADSNYVGIVVRPSQFCRVEVPRKRCSNSMNLIGRDLFAIARTTENNSKCCDSSFLVTNHSKSRVDAEARVII
jgi:ABC-type multidrug transport system fused ATPase/permease subunit